MDIRNQCSGFLYGLSTARAMVRSGQCKHVLLVGAETHSAALDLSTRGRTVASLFGDGAGAVVVSATDEDRGIRGTWLGADGRFALNLCQKVWDIKKRPFIPMNAEGVGQVTGEMAWAHMDGKIVFKHAVEKMCLAVMQACWETQIDIKDIDLFVFHQANMRINQYGRAAALAPREQGRPQHPALRKHHRGDDPHLARRVGAQRQAHARHEGRDGRVRQRLHLGQRHLRLVRESATRSGAMLDETVRSTSRGTPRDRSRSGAPSAGFCLARLAHRPRHLADVPRARRPLRTSSSRRSSSSFPSSSSDVAASARALATAAGRSERMIRPSSARTLEARRHCSSSRTFIGQS